MELGDLVEYGSERWIVASRNALARTVLLSRGPGQPTPEVASDDPSVKVITNPATNWPFLPCQFKPKHGAVKQIFITRGGQTFELELLIDWVPSNFQRPGGPIFFNPDLNLRNGQVLVAVHTDESRSRLSVTRAFGSVQTRQTRQIVKVAQREEAKLPPTVYAHMMQEEDDDDE